MSVESQFVTFICGGTRIFQYLSDLLKGMQNKNIFNPTSVKPTVRRESQVHVAITV
jgi:hypothetical protein